MNDKQQLAAMGAQYRLTEEQAKGLAERMPQTGILQVLDDQPLCMAKRIEEFESKYKAAMEVVRDLVELPYSTGGLLERLEVRERARDLLAGQVREPAVPDALVALSDIASLQRYTLGGHCDSFGQDCGAEMEPDDEGEYILLSEALMLAAAPSPDGTK